MTRRARGPGAAPQGGKVGSEGGRVTAVLLAAGTSSRFGRSKQLAVVDRGVTLVGRAIKMLKLSRCDGIVVVLGSRAAEVRRRLGRVAGVRFVVNPEFRTGLGSSLRRGVAAGAALKSDAVVIALADQPLVTSDLIDELISRHAETGNPVVTSACAGLIAPPVLFARSTFGELQSLKGDTGARSVILKHEPFERIEVPPGTLLDVDTEADLTRARAAIKKAREEVRRARGASGPGRGHPSQS